jgi:hypothetical protein
MAISRSLMERQLRAGGGIMTLEEPRQGYFLGKIVKKAKRVVKKIAKSPITKAALLGAGAMYAGGLGPFAANSTMFGGKLAGLRGAGFAANLLGTGGKLETLGNLFRVGGAEGAKLSAPRILGGLAGAGLIASPFLMGGDEEEEGEPETSFTETPDSIANIVQQARNQDPSLRFLPQPKFVRNFYAADGGLADIPRGGYKSGELVEKLSMLTPAGLGMAAGKKLAEGIKDDENMMIAGSDRYQMILEEIIADMEGMLGRELTNEEYDLAGKKAYERLYDFGAAQGGRVPMQEGGIMDLGGMEKDYRTGGFVELGAEERADDVPARLSKNEFVFTADAVRNAGGGDIDKGAEVMQNMMDNLEAGGNISEESQGMNPAQGMFDQAQMLEGRLA